jgi:hypothetical protein
MTRRLQLDRLPIHPFLISLYPVLALLSYNIKEIEPRAALRALLVSFLLVAAVFGLLWLVTRRPERAGLVASLFAVLFFSYGHVYTFFQDIPGLGALLGKQSGLSVVYLALFLAGVFFSLRKKAISEQLTPTLNFFAVVLVILPVAQMAIALVSFSRSAAQVAKKIPITQPLTAPTGQSLPDVYYIILDTYAGQEYLQKEMGFDNSEFIRQLENMGFSVPRCSLSNYSQTELSLSSTLNLDYLPALDPRYVSGYMDRSELPALLKQSLVRRSLQQIGYRTVAFGTGYSWSEFRDADVFYYPGNNGLLWLGNRAGINQFEAMFVNTTGALVLTTLQSEAFNDLERVVNHPYQDHINIQLFLLDTLERVPDVYGPKFVFTHLLIPHGPFVFGPDGVLPEDQVIGSKEPEGGDLQPETFTKGYLPQVEYINNRILPILKSLIEDSDTPPIIILQGDHGPFSLPTILNAYYLPGNKDIGLYPTITTVNSFRLIFNAYFGTHYELLPDVSYTSFDDDPFGGDIFPNPCQ